MYILKYHAIINKQNHQLFNFGSKHKNLKFKMIQIPINLLIKYLYRIIFQELY